MDGALNADGEEAVTMASRSRDWNLGLAQDLCDPTFAREFLRASIDEGVSVRVTLEDTRDGHALVYPQGPFSIDGAP